MSGILGNAAALFRWLGVQKCQAHSLHTHQFHRIDIGSLHLQENMSIKSNMS